ncbi:MAG TPA: methylenetetrahydrofolate--tRNA-(uracil(54)-C(5))-methyltransferase (FADH(2)-oxidizing) TrmFO [bacterium (Candidatus Stahlbacteria)]|nr:methylenetetrahydrofolate--tRNA-(uracil(54)-C(5))-methyltransferase (FADH(2)-oxidizing) TrmFO [Candidatus Stahlbacteria bacterium]
MKTIVIGGGLSGCEAALQLAQYGVDVILYEMRPFRKTAAHKTDLLAELVCSNSFKSTEIGNAHGLLKFELGLLGSALIEIAREVSLPAGKALAVCREDFSKAVTDKIEGNPKIRVLREEMTSVPIESAIIATGPLTSQKLIEDLKRLIGDDELYFFDAISPIVAGDSIKENKVFRGSRYEVDDSYINCPMDKNTYYQFVEELTKAAVYPLHHFEDPRFFEGCLPIEELAKRGFDTLRFGPMKPVGFQKKHYAVVQLRPEDKEYQMLSMVGCQTRLLIPEQRRVFRLIPGLENARFLRYGAVHRNSYLNSPNNIYPTLQLKEKPDLLIAGQLSGTEGYVEAVATGLLAGINMTRILNNKEPLVPPTDTMLGGLINYITTPNRRFQPMNANFGLLTGYDRRRKVSQAIRSMELWQEQLLNI